MVKQRYSIFVENIPLCFKYYNKIYVYSTVQHNFLFLIFFSATGFSLNDHLQAPIFYSNSIYV